MRREGVTRGEKSAMLGYLGGVFVVMGLIYLYINLRVAEFNPTGGNELERET